MDAIEDKPINWDALEEEVKAWERKNCVIPLGWRIEPVVEMEPVRSVWRWKMPVYA